MSENPTVTIKGQVHDIPPLNTGQVKKHWSRFTDALGAMETLGISGFGALTGAQSEILLLALQNQYPHLTMEDVETLDIADLNEATRIVIENVARPKVKAPATT
jgi:hypothetical protein